MHKIEHGGRCCGIAHIRGFYNEPFDEESPDPHRNGNKISDLDAQLELFRTWDRRRGNEGRAGLVEVCLTDQQMVAWAPHLKERKFRLVTRFFNSNSGNHVNVLHKTFGNTTGANRPARPFNW